MEPQSDGYVEGPARFSLIQPRSTRARHTLHREFREISMVYRHKQSIRALFFASAVALSMPSSAVRAQAFHYPALQLPTVSTRDYTGAVVGGAGSTLLFQWREGWSADRHLQLDLGLSDQRGSASLLLFAGGGVAQQLVRASEAQPLNMVLTGGAGAGFGKGLTFIRIPFGVSLGHSFELENDMSITPYLHPRASLDLCSSCSERGSRKSELSLSFDLGAAFQVTREFGIRVAGSFSGSDLAGGNDNFSVGLSWTPRVVKRE